MVDRLINKNFFSLLLFLKEHRNNDFYYTENNNRQFIDNEKDLKNLIKISKTIFVLEEKGEILGIILLWIADGNNIKRYFVKMNALNNKVANDLLSVLLWNCDKELYVKLKKDSSLIDIYKRKGFKFKGNRGNELLLCRYTINKEK